MAKDVLLLASYFKHPSFAEEREHRIVVISESDATDQVGLKFREGRFSIIPYLELDAPRKLVKNIVIGPTAHKSLAKRALEVFADRHYEAPASIFGPYIELAKTPYRPL